MVVDKSEIVKMVDSVKSHVKGILIVCRLIWSNIVSMRVVTSWIIDQV